MHSDDIDHLARHLTELRTQHRDLDAAIAMMVRSGNADELQLTRLKKRKLQIKDTIARLQSRLIPDLDA